MASAHILLATRFSNRISVVRRKQIHTHTHKYIYTHLYESICIYSCTSVVNSWQAITTCYYRSVYQCGNVAWRSGCSATVYWCATLTLSLHWPSVCVCTCVRAYNCKSVFDFAGLTSIWLWLPLWPQGVAISIFVLIAWTMGIQIAGFCLHGNDNGNSNNNHTP